MCELYVNLHFRKDRIRTVVISFHLLISMFINHISFVPRQWSTTAIYGLTGAACLRNNIFDSIVLSEKSLTSAMSTTAAGVVITLQT